MDLSSEMIHALLPLYITGVLGASTLSLGIIEGLAESIALISKVLSGAFSDWIGKRKFLTAFGYSLSALTKPLFPLAESLTVLVLARFLDRVGKGIRGAPRDAIIGLVSPAELRGACFGLRQTLDTIGAFLGPLIAIALMLLLAADIRQVFWIACIPAFLASILVIFFVSEPALTGEQSQKSKHLHIRDLRSLKKDYWAVVGFAFVLSLARFSEGFLILQGNALGVSLAFTPFILVLMNIAYAITSYPAGAISDRSGRRSLLVLGLLCLISADLSMAFFPGLPGFFIGILLWGIHMGLTQGILSALVNDRTESKLLGSAFGLLNLAMGLGLLLGNTFAGFIWQFCGARFTFLSGAALALIALLLCLSMLAAHEQQSTST